MLRDKNVFINKKGLTLIELLVAIVIMGVVLAIATTMIVQSFNVFRTSTYRMSAGQMAEMTLRQIALEVRAATDFDSENSITLPAEDQDSIEFGHPDYKVKIIYDDENRRLSLLYTENTEENLIISSHSVKSFYIELTNNNEFRLEIEYTGEDGEQKSKSTNVKSRNL